MQTAPALNVCAACAIRQVPVVTSQTISEESVSYQILASNSPIQYYATLPSGLTLNSETGIITGTLGLGVYVIPISARNRVGIGHAILTLNNFCKTGGPYGTLATATGVWSGSGSDIGFVGPKTQYPLGLSMSDAQAWYAANWTSTYNLDFIYSNPIPSGPSPVPFIFNSSFNLDDNTGSCPQDISGFSQDGGSEQFYITIYQSGDINYPIAYAYAGLIWPRIQIMFEANASGGYNPAFLVNSLTIPEIAAWVTASQAFVPSPLSDTSVVKIDGNTILMTTMVAGNPATYRGLATSGTLNITRI